MTPINKLPLVVIANINYVLTPLYILNVDIDLKYQDYIVSQLMKINVFN